MVRIRRVYEEPLADDGARVLVDRIWPRGLSKDGAALTEWCKDVAPSTALRTWYGHVPERFEEFRRRYTGELADPVRAAALQHLRDLADRGRLTLLTATRQVDISAAAVPRHGPRRALTRPTARSGYATSARPAGGCWRWSSRCPSRG